MKLCKLLLASVGATVLLGALVSSATARNYEISEQRMRGIFTNLEYHLPGATTRCALTVEGSLHTRTLPKVIGSLIGYITRVDLGVCSSGSATVLTSTLPWHVRYSGFAGLLPNINSIITHVIGASWRVREAGGIACLARSSTTEPVIGNYHRTPETRELTSAEVRGTIRTGAECFGIAGSFRSDRGTVSVSNAATRVTLNLI
jgi:hypothetical protein